MHKQFFIGIWRLADPKISLASIASMFLGTCAAAHQGSIDVLWLAMIVIGILCFEAAKNASGDVFDYDSGTDQAVAAEDRSPFSGGKRVIVDGLLTRHQTIVVSAILYALGTICGLIIALVREPMVLVVGIIGVFLAYFYHGPPLKLSYRGLGELAVAIVYGPLICGGTYLVFQHQLPAVIILLSLPLGLLIASFLVINEFPDRQADLGAGKMNLVVRLGNRRAGWLFLSLILIAYGGIILLPIAGYGKSVWLGCLGLPLGVAAARRVLSTQKTHLIIPAQRWTLLSFILAALGLGIGSLV